MTEPRRLIVNADDFGRSARINRGIIHAHENGMVTSASLMVRWPDAEEAAAYGRRRPTISLGLHLDFGEWVFRDDEWTESYGVTDVDDGDAVLAEAANQLARFEELMGSQPTHLDSHQHIHTKNENVRTAAEEMAAGLGIPLRSHGDEIKYLGRFYGQTTEGYSLPEQITPEALVEILGEIEPGTTELGCHPGDGSDPPDTYAAERRLEMYALCDPRVRRAIESEGIELVRQGA